MQKITTLFISVFFFTQFIFAQTAIPNSDFENWTGIKPTSWATSDGLFTSFGFPAPGTAERDTNAANVFSGTSMS